MRKNVYYTESWSLDDRPSQIGYELEGYSESSDADKIQYKELSDLFVPNPFWGFLLQPKNIFSSL